MIVNIVDDMNIIIENIVYYINIIKVNIVDDRFVI